MSPCFIFVVVSLTQGQKTPVEAVALPTQTVFISISSIKLSFSWGLFSTFVRPFVRSTIINAMKGKFSAAAIGLILTVAAYAQDAREIVSKAENLAKGEKNSYSEMSMQIVRPKYTRTIEFKAWGET
ncbi:MAG: hypothetical protein LBV32_05600, partial [Tannerellaceae bacterium]|nr:hypothetical protein [Tannerellaceae bacterium]